MGWGSFLLIARYRPASSGGSSVSKALLFHECDICFDIGFHGEDRISRQTRRHTGDLYVKGDDMFLGKDQRWYRMQVSEIESMDSPIGARPLTIKFPDFCVEMASRETMSLKAVHHFLYLYRSQLQHGGAA